MVLDDNKNTNLAENAQREMYLKQEKEFLISFEHAIEASGYFQFILGHLVVIMFLLIVRSHVRTGPIKFVDSGTKTDSSHTVEQIDDIYRSCEYHYTELVFIHVE